MKPSIVLRGAAATLSVAACTLWAAFFVEHLTWFTTASPPRRVWLAELSSLVVAAGLLAAIWRRAMGVAMTAAALVSFFALADWPRAFSLVALTLSPFALFALSDALKPRPSGRA
jgi:hypothetical protein